jgi:ubiquinone/menaquinone biosynthesis C-methylase UbiE
MGHDWLLPLYDTVTKVLRIESHHRDLIERAALASGQRLLEIGCGTGNLTVLIKKLHPRVEVVGIDPDPKALTRARRKAERAQVAVAFDPGFAEELPYPDGSFDRVVSAFMLHHLDPHTKEAALREVGRILKPGGSLHIVDFGGGTGQASGIGARLQRHSKQLEGNRGNRTTTLLAAAGLDDPAEVGHRNTIVGPVSHYRATAPTAAADTAGPSR